LAKQPVAYIQNPSYSGSSDQEDLDSKPTQGKYSETLSRKNLSQKRLVEWLKV
jgi:hypothetical protein